MLVYKQELQYSLARIPQPVTLIISAHIVS